MDVTGINAIMGRINAIQQRIEAIDSFSSGLTKKLNPASDGREKAAGFQSVLDEAVKRQDIKVQQRADRDKLDNRPLAQAGKGPGEMLPPAAANGYAPIINAAAQRNGVDPGLVNAVAAVESGYNQNAVSSAGAVGIMQLMPETAAYLGVNPYDAASNIEGGAKLLGSQLRQYNGDVAKALAAYNAGPGAVEQYGGIPPYTETRNYIQRVMDIYRQTSGTGMK
ncbi:MAG: lytic transglycosylase domain-containing protein [Selenomonadaceae bacterium]|nr:lytic transglycosylase domain-containing protein [Selenomonadaceae bacterium]